MTRVLFLGGLGRSGTTLVERMLGELPGIVALGEVVHLWQRDLRDGEHCGCGEAFRDCAFWQAVGGLAFGGWDNVDVDRVLHLQAAVERTRFVPRLARHRLAPHHRDQVSEYAEYYSRVYAAAARVTGAQVVVDSSKHSALAYCLRWARDVDLRVVHLVRDARGVAYSWTKRVTRPEAGGGAEMTRYTPGRTAWLWNAHNAAFALLRRRGVPVTRMRYEQVVADPERAVRQLAAFAGLDLATTELDFLGAGHVAVGPGHSAAGNPMRFAVGRVPLLPDDAWRSALLPRQRRLVGAICAPLLLSYGYPLRVGAAPAPAPAPASRSGSLCDDTPADTPANSLINSEGGRR